MLHGLQQFFEPVEEDPSHPMPNLILRRALASLPQNGGRMQSAHSYRFLTAWSIVSFISSRRMQMTRMLIESEAEKETIE